MYQGTITRRMQTTRSDIYRSMLTKRDFKLKLARLKSAECSQRPTICASLCEMFDAIGISCESGREDDYYEELVNTTKFRSFKDIELRIMETMFDNFDQYPTPEEYMLRIVRNLSDSSDNWQDDPLRLQILKRFIRYCDCLTFKSDSGRVNVYGGKGYIEKYAREKKGSKIKEGEDIIQYIDDGIFDTLASASKDQKKSDGTYGILKLADDLAHGKFRAGGATKRDLYMFAIAFEMTYSVNGGSGSAETEELFDYRSDIEKNLFSDYYTNNLMRFITDAYEGNQNAFELDPSGQGINYKNFAEMVYIYFISKDTEKYTPAEKLKYATEMIERLKASESVSRDDDTSTKYYEMLFTEDILRLPEAEFEKFIAENYDCDVEFEDEDKKGNKYKSRKGVLQLQTSQNTAFKSYNRLIRKMEKGSPDVKGFSRKECNYGLWFVDVSMIRQTDGDVLKKFAEGKDKDTDPEKMDKFIKLLYGINMFLGTETPGQQIRLMSINKPEDMTRTALITAFYYRYNRRYEHRRFGKSFIEVFDDYSDPVTGLSSILEDAGYQPINDKNIFDMAVIFSSYAYLNA